MQSRAMAVIACLLLDVVGFGPLAPFDALAGPLDQALTGEDRGAPAPVYILLAAAAFDDRSDSVIFLEFRCVASAVAVGAEEHTKPGCQRRCRAGVEPVSRRCRAGVAPVSPPLSFPFCCASAEWQFSLLAQLRGLAAKNGGFRAPLNRMYLISSGIFFKGACSAGRPPCGPFTTLAGREIRAKNGFQIRLASGDCRERSEEKLQGGARTD